jgi:hypothetical protein
MAQHTAMIDGVQVPGGRYVVYGKKRGFVSSHRTKRAAYGSLVEDSRKGMQTDNPSDAQVYRWRDGWVPEWQEVVDVELITPPDSASAGP